MNTVNTKFSFIELWFTGQTSKALEIEDNVIYWAIITPIIGKSLRV